MLPFLIAACLEPLFPQHLRCMEVTRLCLTCKDLTNELRNTNGVVLQTMMSILGRSSSMRRNAAWVNRFMSKIVTRCHYCMQRTSCRRCKHNDEYITLCADCCSTELVDRKQIIYMWVKYASFSGFRLNKFYINLKLRDLQIAKVSKRSKAYLFWRKDIVKQIQKYHTSRTILNAPRAIRLKAKDVNEDTRNES